MKTTSNAFQFLYLILLGPLQSLSAAPEIEVLNFGGVINSKESFSFGSGRAKIVSGTRVLTIKNSGDMVLSGLKIRKKGGRFSDFTISRLRVKSLAPGKSMTLAVTFKSSTKGRSATSLLISSNDADENPFVVRLDGNGEKDKINYINTTVNFEAPILTTIFTTLHAEVMIGSELMSDLNYQAFTEMNSSQNHVAISMVEAPPNWTDWYSDRVKFLTDNADFYTVRDNTPISDEQKRFIRLSEAK